MGPLLLPVGVASLSLEQKHKLPNGRCWSWAKIVATPDGSELPYYRIADVYFEDMEQMQRSLASEEGQAVFADLQNFATGGVTLFFSEIDS